MERFLVRLVIGLMLAITWTGSAAAADWKSDIGYAKLQAELGGQMLTGAGVKVTQIEANFGKPDPSNSQFTGKAFTLQTPYLSIASHATTVGQYFYGNSASIAAGITNIDCYDCDDWRSTFLGAGGSAPLISTSRVANHSYVSTTTSSSIVVPALARTDWLVSRDEYIQVVGMNNAGSNVPFMGSSFNAIAVGLSNGTAAYGAYALASTPSTPYASASRTRPDLVAPASATSYATPMVSSATALLVQEGHQNPALSTDPVSQSTTNRNGDTIYNAERSEVVKAALMAGARRRTSSLTNGYTVNTANGLNNIYGAGQLSVYNSYHIIAAGEQNSLEDYGAGYGEIKAAGFDYDPQFGGLNSNRTGTYVFRALTTGTLKASLVWNLMVNGGTTFDTTATLYHLGLHLYDMTSGTNLADSTSSVDNTENIWWNNLMPFHAYRLQVTAEQSDFLWDYGLAWDISAITTHAPLPPTVYLLGSGLLAIFWFRRNRSRS